MLKFVPPGADRVPESAFFTPRGRQMRQQEPDYSFRRSFLEAMADGIAQDLAGR
jgi:hypothetical protein